MTFTSNLSPKIQEGLPPECKILLDLPDEAFTIWLKHEEPVNEHGKTNLIGVTKGIVLKHSYPSASAYKAMLCAIFLFSYEWVEQFGPITNNEQAISLFNAFFARSEEIGVQEFTKEEVEQHLALERAFKAPSAKGFA